MYVISYWPCYHVGGGPLGLKVQKTGNIVSPFSVYLELVVVLWCVWCFCFKVGPRHIRYSIVPSGEVLSWDVFWCLSLAPIFSRVDFVTSI